MFPRLRAGPTRTKFLEVMVKAHDSTKILYSSMHLTDGERTLSNLITPTSTKADRHDRYSEADNPIARGLTADSTCRAKRCILL